MLNLPTVCEHIFCPEIFSWRYQMFAEGKSKLSSIYKCEMKQINHRWLH